MIKAILIIAVVAVAAWLLRSLGGGSRSATTDGRTPAAGDGQAQDAYEDMDDDSGAEAVAVTADGWAFVPVRGGVELVPPGEDDELLDESMRPSPQHPPLRSAPTNPHTGKRMVQWKPGEPLSTGDLIAARVVRGGADVDPWRLEALGRDYDYRSFPFETEDSARTACDLVAERIVRPPRDEDGAEIPVGAEDFAVARRKAEETEEALAVTDDDIEDGPSR